MTIKIERNQQHEMTQFLMMDSCSYSHYGATNFAICFITLTKYIECNMLKGFEGFALLMYIAFLSLNLLISQKSLELLKI